MLVSKWVKSQKTEKTAPPTNPSTAPRRKFLLLLRYQLLIDVNVTRVKILPLLCRLGLVLWFGSVYVWFIEKQQTYHCQGSKER